MSLNKQLEEAHQLLVLRRFQSSLEDPTIIKTNEKQERFPLFFLFHFEIQFIPLASLIRSNPAIRAMYTKHLIKH